MFKVTFYSKFLFDFLSHCFSCCCCVCRMSMDYFLCIFVFCFCFVLFCFVSFLAFIGLFDAFVYIFQLCQQFSLEEIGCPRFGMLAIINNRSKIKINKNKMKTTEIYVKRKEKKDGKQNFKMFLLCCW